MAMLKLVPCFKDYLWGGHRLAEEYNKQYDGPVLAESWELSCHPDGPSRIANGPWAGDTLVNFLEKEGKAALGTHCERFDDFPILIKFIDAKDNLSVQVHPNNEYAQIHEGQQGKTEVWYVTDSKKGACLYCGFKQEISKEEFEQRIQDGTLMDVLNAVPVQKGDVVFIEAGTIHAIGKDVVIAEIQQNSNVTYRVYDYNRTDAQGNKRQLHVDKALDVTKREPMERNNACYPHLADCDYFTVDKVNLDGRTMKKMTGLVDETSFACVVVTEGAGTIRCGEEELDYRKGDTFFLSAGSGAFEIEGNCETLITTIR